ncbi:hypothetical protein J6590_003072 [Homalodisca vitripennis]|nr:hypothetical protein J6590_003072 [Homalodisca vitripennis]
MHRVRTAIASSGNTVRRANVFVFTPAEDKLKKEIIKCVSAGIPRRRRAELVVGGLRDMRGKVVLPQFAGNPATLKSCKERASFSHIWVTLQTIDLCNRECSGSGSAGSGWQLAAQQDCTATTTSSRRLAVTRASAPGLVTRPETTAHSQYCVVCSAVTWSPEVDVCAMSLRPRSGVLHAYT